MLHYTDRNDVVYVLTLDPVLGEDVYQRLSSEPRLKGTEIIVPGRDSGEYSPAEIDKITKDTMAGRVFVMDTRSQSQAKLQQVYNKIIGYNRADFNQFCYTVLIGDGPVEFFAENGSIESFSSHMARLRLDFNAARFFYDPLIHYDHHEKLGLAIDQGNSLLETIPGWLEKGFAVEGEDITVRQIRPYFRAEGKKGKVGRAKKKKRQKKLTKIFSKLIRKKVKCPKEDIEQCIGKEGLLLQGQALPLNVYPFYFEKYVAKFMKKSKTATG